jgi:hypothetical protein
MDLEHRNGKIECRNVYAGEIFCPILLLLQLVHHIGPASAFRHRGRSDTASHDLCIYSEQLWDPLEYPSNLNPNSKTISTMSQGFIWGRFMKKSRGQKCRATVLEHNLRRKGDKASHIIKPKELFLGIA